MSLGTAIFLSSIFLGIVALYIATKDRWNWRKIVPYSLGGLIGLAMLIAAGLWTHSLISNRPHIETVFWDIPISASKSDIKFLKGEPNRKEDEDVWFYEPQEWKLKGSIYMILFRDNKVFAIIYEGDSIHSPWIQGIHYGDNYNSIIKKFRSPSYISTSEDELGKTLSYDRYNIAFELKENKVIAYGVYNGALGQLTYIKGLKSEVKK
ncbi:MAG: hypothetical protein Q8P40_11060 [Nitrospirota bacterium]|nr:hypothetical protein [Nitrospirota bacterium]